MPEIKAEVDSGALFIYRPTGSTAKITGSNLSANVQDGSLVVTSNGAMIYILSPGQWVSVNFDPATA